jgi:hypothetical protein
MAAYLCIDQSSVSRMEKGQPLPGPVMKLLEQLAAEATEQTGSAA